MKLIVGLFAFSAVMASQSFAGIPTTKCSTPDAGVRIVSDMPGVEALYIQTGAQSTKKIPMINVVKTVENETILQENRGDRSYSKVFTAKITFKGDSVTQLPEPYTANANDDGSITVDMICTFFIF